MGLTELILYLVYCAIFVALRALYVSVMDLSVMKIIHQANLDAIERNDFGAAEHGLKAYDKLEAGYARRVFDITSWRMRALYRDLLE